MSIAVQRVLWLVCLAVVMLIVAVGASVSTPGRWMDVLVIVGLPVFWGLWFRFGVRRGLVRAVWWPDLGEERARRAALVQEREDILAEARKKQT